MNRTRSDSDGKSVLPIKEASRPRARPGDRRYLSLRLFIYFIYLPMQQPLKKRIIGNCFFPLSVALDLPP